VPQLELIGSGPSFRQELCERLAECQMLADLPWADLETLAKYVQAYRAAAGGTIFGEGEAGDFLGFVLAGRVEIRKEDHDGVAQVVGSIAAGRSLGEMAVIDGEKRSATCVAQGGEVLVALLTKHSFDELLRAYPVLGNKLLLRIARLLSQRLRQTSGLLVDYLGH
jgi:CRP/FNR family transcriptional regulator, cyclic AMP receptor protein